VSNFQLFGAQYAMRIWLDPTKLDNYGLTSIDVANAIKAQNVQVASGELGREPAVAGQQLNATIIGPTYLHTPEQFGQILLRAEPNGSQVRLRDVARIGLGGENYQTIQEWNGDPAAGFVIKLASGANALETVSGVKAVLAGLESTFPPGLKVIYPLDTTPFVRHSVKDVMLTLAEAIGLVFLVMLLFLQNVRATLIPTIAIPVVLLGTAAVLAAAAADSHDFLRLHPRRLAARNRLGRGLWRPERHWHWSCRWNAHGHRSRNLSRPGVFRRRAAPGRISPSPRQRNAQPARGARRRRLECLHDDPAL
jgi:multidrug efflux pump